MKQYLFLATAIATASLFTGCSNNEYVGDQPDALNGIDGAIVFSMGKANTTRAEGSSDADKLNKVFYVYGEKTLSVQSDPVVVFKNYKVSYSDGTKSPSNTKWWEYVGQSYEHNEGTNVTPNYTQNSSGTQSQSIKYWDYSASSYNFYAFSAKPGDISNGNIQVVKKTSGENEYEVTVKQGASVSDLYFADKVEISKSTNSTATVSNQYGGFVTLTFRNVGSKIRMGFYETIPGYDVNIKSLTIACPNSTPKSDGTPTSKVTVKYDSNTATLNQPLITTAGFDSQNSLDLGNDATTPDKIGENYNTLTWTKRGGIYTPVWPQSNVSDKCKVTVNYSLRSTDGSNETIEVTGATAEVPTECIMWQSNYAYTYVFKISDQTNGTTGTVGQDPAGLYPITFDAVVTDNAIGNEEFLTTVSELSVTATQNETFLDPDKAVFKTNKEITLKVMKDGTEVSNYTLKAWYLNDYQYQNSFSANVGSTVETDIITPGILPAKDTEGYWALKVEYTDTTNGTNATTYVVLKVDASN